MYDSAWTLTTLSDDTPLHMLAESEQIVVPPALLISALLEQCGDDEVRAVARHALLFLFIHWLDHDLVALRPLGPGAP
jgi:hypothetical protein